MLLSLYFLTNFYFTKLFSQSFQNLWKILHQLLCKRSSWEYNWCRGKRQKSPALSFSCLQTLPQNFVGMGAKILTMFFLFNNPLTFVGLHNRLIDLVVVQKQFPKVIFKIIVPSWDQIFRRHLKMSSFLVYLNSSVLLTFWPWVILPMS